MKQYCLNLFNSLSGKQERFVPKNAQHVGMYVCGPTTYARPHIGNLRSVVVYDILYRLLKLLYPKVTYVRNITDVDDKIINEAQKQNCNISELSEKVTQNFHHDLRLMHCLEPTKEPKVSNHISEIIGMIETLVNRGHAYTHDKADTMFSVTSDSQYGILSKREIEKQITGIRISSTNKADGNDFVLWKESSQPHWTSPFGLGRPGWHIECSAMSNLYLNDDTDMDIFDIHGGGVDLKFPHHENELAQSRCAGVATPNYWIHNGFLLLEGEKMSKSLGNAQTLEDIIQRGCKAEAVRWALLGTHYRKPLNFTNILLENAQDSLEKFHHTLQQNTDLFSAIDFSDLTLDNIPKVALECLLDDLNIPRYSAVMFSHFKDIRHTKDVASRTQLIKEFYHMGLIIGLFSDIASITDVRTVVKLENEAELPHFLQQMLQERKLCRESSDFTKADELRQKIYHLGFSIEDAPDGTTRTYTRSSKKMEAPHKSNDINISE